MSQVGLFFGSDEGNTEAVAYRIKQRFGDEICEVHDIGEVTQLEFADYQYVILGIPTWDFGQIQSDWEEFWQDIAEVDFTGKTVALFGLGDQFGYGDFFLDAMGMLHDVVKSNGATIVGHWSTEGYEFDASKALVKGESEGANEIERKDKFVGLGIDEDQQPELTSSRLNQWCRELHSKFGLDLPILDLDD